MIQIKHKFSSEWLLKAEKIDFASYRFDSFVEEGFRGHITFVIDQADFSFPSACLLDFVKNMIFGISHLIFFDETVDYYFPDTEFGIKLKLINSEKLVISANYIEQQAAISLSEFSLVFGGFVESVVLDCLKLHPNLRRNPQFVEWLPDGWRIFRRLGIEGIAGT